MSVENAMADLLGEMEGEEESRERIRRASELARAKRTSTEWQKLANALQRELDLSEQRVEALLAIKVPAPVVQIDPLPAKGKRNAAIAGAVASDWHVGERVDPASVNGANEYDPTICDRRATKFWQRVLRMVEIQRGGAEVREFVLFLGGDMIGGFIHEDLRLTNYLSPTEEVRFAKRLLVAGIDLLLREGGFKRLHVPCCYGNHGRTNPGKPLIGAAARNSYEVMLYADLADHYRADKRVSFSISQGPFLYLDLGGFILRLTHGDTFRYQGGIGGLTIPLLKSLHRWDTTRRADLTLFGHWHQYLPGARFLGNGSLKGFDTYAAHIGCEYEPPSQAFFMIDPARRRRTVAEPIFVE